MQNFVCLLLAIVSTFLVVGISFKLLEKREQYIGCDFLVCASYCVLQWCICYVFYFSENVLTNIIHWYSFKNLGIYFLPVMLFLFVIKFINTDIEISKKLVTILIIVPIVSFILVITNKFHLLIYEEVKVVSMSPIKEIHSVSGSWSYIMLIYSNSLYLMSLFLIGYKFKDATNFYKKRIFMLFVSFLIILVFNTLEFFSYLDSINLGFIFPVISIILLFNGIFEYNSSDFMLLAKDTVFEKISCVALVLDSNEKIVSFNKKAKDIFEFMYDDIEGVYFFELIKKWVRNANGRFEKEDDSDIISIVIKQKRYYYQITRSPIIDKKYNNVGTFVEMIDITKQQELIQELFSLVNTDQLTGLFNRRYFDAMCKKYDNKNYYPLCVISADLNRLKHTNDTFGHAVGDRLIQLISIILKSSAPKKAVVSRHGGDEFFILIPNTNHDEIISFIRRVDDTCLRTYEEPFGNPSISLGYALKIEDSKNIKDVIDEADKMMYEVKQNKHEMGMLFKDIRF